MTQAQLTKQLTELTGIGAKHAKAFLEAFAQIVEQNDVVPIQGFGTFKKVTVAARTGRNPRTGEAVQIPEKVKLTFKASKKV